MRSISVTYHGFAITGNKKLGFTGKNPRNDVQFSSPKLDNLKNHVRKLYDSKGMPKEKNEPSKISPETN